MASRSNPVHPKVVGGHDWSEEYGLRRQSAATTALWAAGGSLRLAQASGQSDAESGVARRLPPQSKKSPSGPSGNFAFMVANYAAGDRRRFDCYASEADALEAAEKLARRLDSRDYAAASMTRDQALEYATAVARLKPFNVTVDSATATVAEGSRLPCDLSENRAEERFPAQPRRSAGDLSER